MLKTLYVYRKLLNGKELRQWAKKQGFHKTLKPEDFHVTITYSKDLVDWSEISPDNKPITVINWDEAEKPSNSKDTLLSVSRENKRKMKQFGEASVLTFSCDYFKDRWSEFIKYGASHDFSTYQPHVTISYGFEGDIKKIKPYTGPLVFGPEIFEEINEDYVDDVVEINT